MTDKDRDHKSGNQNYPRPGGYLVAAHVVGGFELSSPLPDLENLHKHALAVLKRVHLLVEGDRNVITELPRVALVDAIDACDQLMNATFRSYSEPDTPPIAVIANFANYSIDSRAALTQLIHCIDRLREWLTNDKPDSPVSIPPSSVTDPLARCVSAIATEINLLRPSRRGRMLTIDEIAEFARVRDIARQSVSEEMLKEVRKLDERVEIEPWLRSILGDPTNTPHNSTEIADILTSAVNYAGARRLAAFVNKGKSLKRVSAKDVTHQIFRLGQLQGLECIVLLAVGDIQDDVKRDFFRFASDGNYDHLIVDAVDVARLFSAYNKVCNTHGSPLRDGKCTKCMTNEADT